MTRPIASIGFTYLIAALVAVTLPNRVCIALAMLFAACGLLTLASKSPARNSVLILFFTAGLAMTSVAVNNALLWEPARQLSGEAIPISGRVTEVRGERSIVIRTPEGISIEVSARESIGAQVGDHFSTNLVQLKAYESGSTSAYRLRRSKLVPLSGFVPADFQVDPVPTAWNAWANQLRGRMSDSLRRHLSGYQGDLLAGILLGERFHIDPAIRSDFQNAGLAHLLVVSGYHISLLLSCVRTFLRRLRTPRWVDFSILMAALLFYVSMIGPTPAVLRSAVTTMLFLTANLSLRSYHPLTALALAGLIICLPNPFMVVDTSFQMSFVSTLGIIVLVNPLQSWLQAHLLPRIRSRFKRSILEVVAVSISASLFLLPVLALSDIPFAPYGLLSNLLVAPLIPIAMIGGMLAMLFSLLPGLGWIVMPLLWAAGVSIGLVASVVSVIARFPFASLSASAGFVVLWLAAVGIIIVICRIGPTPQKTRAGIALSTLTLLIGIGSYQWVMHDAVQVTVFRTSDSAAMVAVKNRRAAVIGDIRSKSDAFRLREVMRRYNISSVDLAALWPARLARSASVAEVLGSYGVDTAILPEEDLQDERFLSLLRPARAGTGSGWEIDLLGGERIRMEPGVTFAEFGGIKTFLLTGECDILNCMMREGTPGVAILTDDMPQNLDRLRCASLISNEIYGGVRLDLSAQTVVLNEATIEAEFLCKEGRMRMFF